MAESYDVVVIGAGVFGAWIAHRLRSSGRSVALLDAYGAGNNRSSSGDESRIIRMGYGANEIYTRWATHSLDLWIEIFDRAGQPELFQNTGVLWTAPPGDPRTVQTLGTLEKCGSTFQRWEAAELGARFPQFQFSSERMAIFEPGSGVLLARRAVRTVVEEAVRNGVDYFRAAALAPDAGAVRTNTAQTLHAGAFVYACGPWLPKVFPTLLAGRIRPTRQEVFYFGTPTGDRRFTLPEMPAWIDFSDERGPYGLPDIESRGIKLGFDRHGPDFDPDIGERIATGVDAARAFLAERIPALAGAPLLESRVCQYENTSTGDFLIDRHPDLPNVWLVGGGSGHGFKHGPMVGEYVAARMDGSADAEPRFSLAAKTRAEERAVY
ncbi:MAG TPA: FAD-dependent oxidoreductase [Bryobacteraceae bacterium]|nr:FAD-dependent oxidoreductase [Bryobacteraceae bacterium]